MTTISELAGELGISKNAINHRIDTLGMRTKLSKVGNKYVLNDQQANRIRAIYSTEQPTNETTEQPTNETTEQLIQALLTNIEILQNELETKNKQLEAKDNQINELHQIIKSNALLKVQERNNIITIEDQQRKQSKPSLFERIFGKRNTITGEETADSDKE